MASVSACAQVRRLSSNREEALAEVSEGRVYRCLCLSPLALCICLSPALFELERCAGSLAPACVSHRWLTLLRASWFMFHMHSDCCPSKCIDPTHCLLTLLCSAVLLSLCSPALMPADIEYASSSSDDDGEPCAFLLGSLCSTTLNGLSWSRALRLLFAVECPRCVPHLVTAASFCRLCIRSVWSAAFLVVVNDREFFPNLPACVAIYLCPIGL